MEILLQHLERSANVIRDDMRYPFTRSFLDDAPDDWTTQFFELKGGQDLILEKASRVLAIQDFDTRRGADLTSAVVKATLKRTYGRNEGFLATINEHLPAKVTLRFDVEISVAEASPGKVSVKMSRRLPSWYAEFRSSLERELASVQASYTDAYHVSHNVVLGPGEPLKSAFDGQLLDYSGCAADPDIADLVKSKGDDKVLPLGVYAFDPKPELVAPDRLLYLSKFGNKPMEYNGTLIVAPQNSGKTQLIIRWAVAASNAGYNLFIVDVKGDMLPELRKAGLRGPVHYLSTSPDADDEIDGEKLAQFNILDELDPTTILGRTEIRLLCEALLPNFGGDDARLWPIRVRWLRALICLQKLKDLHYGTVSDLSDIYDLATTESDLYELIVQIKAAEEYQKSENPNVSLPVPLSDFWVNQLSTVITRNHPVIQGGARQPEYTYPTLLIDVASALEPFYRYGALYPRTRGKGDFQLQDLDGKDQTTVILAAREHDGEDAQALSALVLKRLEQILKRRFSEPEPARKILLLLDETRRIKGFSPGKYITFARAAKAGCVLAYQSIDQIENDKEVDEVMSNAGTQIFLQSVTGDTADRLLKLLPMRNQPEYSHGLSGFVKSQEVKQGTVPCIGKTELYKLPAGRFPALVFIKDHGRGKPILVDMWDERIQKLQQSIS